jgi:hypothetical protein
MMLTSPLTHEAIERRHVKQFTYSAELSPSTKLHSNDMNRLLTAAVVSHKFCNLLLNDPLEAIAKGYNGETFQLTAEEMQLLDAIKASTLRDFVKQLLMKSLIPEKSWSDTQATLPLNPVYAVA